jgi:arylsulfatase A-like enzyme
MKLWHKCRLMILFVLGMLLSSFRELSAAEPPAAPNIVFILADDLGWKDVGYHGSEIKTPNIDGLAAIGAKLEQFYVTPLCSPTRACLLTGRYPMRQGLQTLVIFPWAQYGLPLEERTLPQALKQCGYETSMLGKWHLGHFKKAYLPLQRGFDHHYGLYNGAMQYFTHNIDGGLDWHRDGKPVREEGYATELLGAEAVKVISNHDVTKPLFLYVAFNAPHAPLQVPEAYLKKYENIKDQTRRKFAAMVDCEDKEIGNIITALKTKQVLENTILVFCSDNGGHEASGANNGELRAGKGTFYEGGVRVPCCISWAGKIKPGTIIKAPMHVSDWYPTLLTRAGGNLNQPLKIDGVDLWPALTEGAPLPDRNLLLNLTPGSGAVLSGDWKLVLNGNNISEELATLGPKRDRRPRPAKKNDLVELFKLADDPSESTNIASKYPEKVEELQALLKQFRDEALPAKAQPEPDDFKAPAIWGNESE